MATVEVIDGFKLLVDEVPPRNDKSEPIATLPLVNDGRSISITDDVFSHGLLVVGRPGTGKTNLFCFLLDGILRFLRGRGAHKAVVFDPKGDFRRRFARPGDTVIRATGQADDAWNLVAELNQPGDSEEDRQIILNDIGHLLFDQLADRSAAQPFFPLAARDVFCGVLSHIARRPTETNATLRKAFASNDIRDIRGLLYQSDDTRWLVDYLPEWAEEQAVGVIATLKQVVNDVFQGRFAAAGDISIRREIRKQTVGGHCIFVEFPVASGRTIAPGFQVILDLAIREAIVAGEDELEKHGRVDSRTFFLLDEFPRVPRLLHLETGINFGRGLGLRFALGLQSSKQALSAFPDDGETILSGLGTTFAHHVADEATRDFIKGRSGKNVKRAAVRSTGLGEPTEHINFDAHVAEDFDIASLERGQAICVMPAAPPFKVTLRRYEDSFRSKQRS